MSDEKSSAVLFIKKEKKRRLTKLKIGMSERAADIFSKKLPTYMHRFFFHSFVFEQWKKKKVTDKKDKHLHIVERWLSSFCAISVFSRLFKLGFTEYSI